MIRLFVASAMFIGLAVFSHHSFAKDLMDGEFIAAKDKVDLLADEIVYDQNLNTVTALGGVEMVQAGRILRTDKISYDINLDKIEAIGNVVLTETTGEVIFADQVNLENNMKDGFVKSIRATLLDGSRFSAEEAQRVAGVKVVMRRASYTACQVCKNDPDKIPLWQIKAAKVVHDNVDKRIAYSDARFEILGVPVFYLPYFTHPDGSIKSKSGLLVPDLGFDSRQGLTYHQEYFWNLAPNKDATIGVVASAKEAPLLLGEYRQRFKGAEILLKGGTTYSQRVDDRAGEEVLLDEKARGHISVDGRWDINEKWRGGADLAVVSDDQYFRQYDLNDEDVLKNQIYVERFSDRNYALGRLIRFQDLRINEEREDQPNILPQVHTNFLGKPNALMGGRWSVSTSALGLQREGSEQDLARVSLGAGWQRRHISNQGLVTKLDLSTRGDFYETNDVTQSSSTLNDKDQSISRGFVRGHVQTSYPLKKPLEKADVVVEPMVALTTTSNVDNNSLVPNEDSNEVVIDALTLFNPDHFAGYDRVDDRTHATYGLSTGLYGHNGYNGRVFAGQVYRFDDEDNPYSIGSGLSEEQSDFVGQISTQLGERLALDYRMQLANDNLASRRHEVDALTKLGRLQLGGRYFYAGAIDSDNEDLQESREQIYSSARYNVTGDWYAKGSVQYDLSNENEGLREATYGVDYAGQCLDLSFTGTRTLTRDSSGDSDTAFKVRLGLKNLGE